MEVGSRKWTREMTATIAAELEQKKKATKKAQAQPPVVFSPTGEKPPKNRYELKARGPEPGLDPKDVDTRRHLQMGKALPTKCMEFFATLELFCRSFSLVF